MNCKKGDLAIIIRCTFEENIGMIVEVIEGPFAPDEYSEALYWKIATKGRLMRYRDRKYGDVGYDSWGYLADSGLRPIRPFPEELSIEQKDKALV